MSVPKNKFPKQPRYNPDNLNWLNLSIADLGKLNITAIEKLGIFRRLDALCFYIVDIVDLKKIPGINDGFAQQIVDVLRNSGLDLGLSPNDEQKRHLFSDGDRIKILLKIEGARSRLHGLPADFRAPVKVKPKQMYSTKEIPAGLFEWYYESYQIPWLGGDIYSPSRFKCLFPGDELTPLEQS